MNSVSASHPRFPSFDQWSPIGVIASGIFVIDLFIPLGVATGVLYIAAVLPSLRHRNSHLSLGTAVVCSLLTIIAFFASPAGGELWKVLFNRVLALFAIWTAALMGRHQLAQAQTIKIQDCTMQKFMESLPIACFSFDREGTVLSWNAAAEQIYGYSKDEAVGASSYDLIVTPETHTETMNVITGIFQGKTFTNMVWHDQNQNGEHGWRAGSLYPVFDLEGHIAYGVNFNIDITPQKTAEIELQQKNALLEAILNSSHDAIFAKDSAGKYLVVNQSAAIVMRHTAESAIGLDDIQAFGPDRGKILQQSDAKIVSHGQSTQLEETVTIGGNSRTFFTTKSPLKTSTGTIIGLVEISRDITEWKQAQNDLLLTARVFDTSPDHISILGKNYRYRRVNRAYEKAHHKSSQEFVGMSVADLLGKEAFSQTVKPMLDRCFQGEDVHYEAWFTFADGQDHFMSVSYVPLTEDHQKIEEIVVISRDLTDRKRMEDALKSSERQLRTILDAMTNFIGIATVDGIVIDCNQAPLSIASLTREDVIGKSFIDTYWLNYSPTVQEQVHHIIQRVGQGEIVREDTPARMGENQFLIIDACYVPVRDMNGRITQIVASGTDVTARRSAEEAVKRSDEQFRDLYESAPLAYFSAALDGTITRVNARTCELLGYSREELIGTSVLSLYASSNHGYGKAVELQQQIQSGKAIHDEELEMRRKDGRHIWISLTVRLIFDESGQIVERRGMGQDITHRKTIEMELRASEHRFRMLIETAGSIIIGLTPDGWIVEWNREAERLYGKSREEVLDKNYFELFITDSERAHILADIKRVLTGEPTRDYQHPVLDVNDKLQDILWNVDRLLDENHQPYGVICIGRDVTEWNRTQAELQKWATIYQHTQWGVAVGNANSYTLDMVNEAYARMHGYTVQELQGQPISHVFAPEFRSKLSAMIQLIHERGFHSFESLHIRKDGTTFPALLTVSTVKNTAGVVLYRVANVIDISNIKQAEQALLESQQIYQDLVQTIDGIVWECEFPSMQVTFVSQYAEQLLGYSLQQWHDDPLFILNMIHPEDRQNIAVHCRAATLRKDNHVIEYRVLHANGTIFWVKDHVTVVIDNDRPVKLRGVIFDITELKKTEQQLRENEIFTNSILENLPNMVFVKNAENLQFVRINQAGENLLGYDRQDLVGKHDFDFFPENEAEFFYKNDQFVLNSRKLIDIPEEFIHTKDGQVRILHTKKLPICDEAGKPQFLLGISEDITDQKRIQEELRTTESTLKSFFDSAPMMMGVVEVTSDDIHHLSDNQATAVFFGQPNGGTTGKWYSQLGLPQEVMKIWIEHYQLSLKTHQPISFEYAHPLVKEIRWVAATVTPVLFKGSAHPRCAYIAQDITERKTMEEQVRSHAVELEKEVETRAERIQELEQRRMQVEKLAALAQIAAGVAHEINNPLASISQSLVLLKRAIPSDHPHFRYMAKAEDCIERIATITKHLYQLYRPSSPTPIPIDIGHCIQTASEIMEERAERHQVSIHVLPHARPIITHGSQGELIQVLCNLIHNAIDASRPGSTIKVSVANGSETLSICVADQGEGIPSETLPHIFEPFFTTKQGEEEGGMGLGLSINHSLVESMGGILDFESEIGHGTTFRITLPLT